MNRETGNGGASGTTISLHIPAREPALFRHEATNDLLLFLSNHRYGDFTIRRLADQTGYSTTTISSTVDVLEANDLVETHRAGNSRRVSINRERLDVPEDPINQIPQSEFHEPVRTVVELLTDRIENVVAILLYGSVARGQADRKSDIDLWVLVSEDRSRAQREATDIAQSLGDDSFNPNQQRFEFHIDVEAVESIMLYSEDIAEIVTSGIPVHTTGDFEKAITIIDQLVEDELDE